MTSGRSLSLLASIAALALAIATVLSLPSTANAHPFGGPCARITMVSADASYMLHLVNENSARLGLNNRQVGSSIVVKVPERIGILIDHTGDVKWDHEDFDNGQIGFEDETDNDFNDAVIRVEPVSCPSRRSNPAPTPTPTATPLEVSFDEATYSVNEGSSVTVTVNVSPNADRSVEIPVSVTDGTADSDDYSVSGLTGGKLSLASGESSASFIITAVEDSDSGAETLDLSFGNLSNGVSQGTQATAQVTIKDPVAELEVFFDEATYSVNEGSSVTVTVNVSPNADRELEVPVSISDDAETGDYQVSGLTGGKLSFASGDSSASFTISTLDDTDRDDETLDLSFGNLPNRVSEGMQSTAQVTIEDPVAGLVVSFNEAAYTVNEGSGVTVAVNVSPNADRELEIPVSISSENAENGDYSVSGLTEGKLSFTSGDSSASFTISTVDDADRDDETVSLSFGELPDAVSAGAQATAQVTIGDTTPAPRSIRRSYGGNSGGGGVGFASQQINQPPVFTEGGNAVRSVAENSEILTNVGSPVSATDLDGDTLVYTLGGPDAVSFSLDSGTGQLKTAIEMDYEMKDSYFVIVYAFDARGGKDTIVVAVRVTDVAEQAVVAEVPAPTPEPQPVVTPTPEPTATATPQPTVAPIPTPNPVATSTPEPTATPHPTAAPALTPVVGLWITDSPKPTPLPTSTPVAWPTATPQPTPTNVPDLSNDSQVAIFVEYQGRGPLGDFQSGSLRPSVATVPVESLRLRIWPIVLIVIGTALMVISIGMLISGGHKNRE